MSGTYFREIRKNRSSVIRRSVQTGITAVYLSYLESGARNPSLNTYIKLCKVNNDSRYFSDEDENYYLDIRKLRNLMFEKKLSYDDLAGLLHVSSRSVRGWFLPSNSKPTTPRIKTVFAICEVFGKPLMDMVTTYNPFAA